MSSAAFPADPAQQSTVLHFENALLTTGWARNVEMLEAGFTHVGEFHYLHHAPNGQCYANIAENAERIVAAATLTGLGPSLLPVFYAQGTANHHRGVQVGVAPHGLRAVSPQQLSALVSLAGRKPIHIHVADQRKEVQECVAWSGARPVRWLFDNAPLDRRWCLVHATHIDDDEKLAIAACGAAVELCPITEANLGDGIFPASTFLDAGGRFGIGSDSNVLIRMPEELRLLEYGQRLRDQSAAT